MLQSDIENLIRDRLPAIFGVRELEDSPQWAERFKAVVDSAIAASEPSFRQETSRYQTMILYWSLALGALMLFNVDELKIVDINVKVSSNLLTILSVFIACLIAVFAAKATLDFQRGRLTLSKYAYAMSLATSFSRVANLRRHLQRHYWYKTFDEIGAAYVAYDEARSASLGIPTSTKLITMADIVPLDPQVKAISELAADLVSMEAAFDELTVSLNKDIARFRSCVEVINLSRSNNDTMSDQSQRMSAIDEAYGLSLRPWLETRDKRQVEQRAFV